MYKKLCDILSSSIIFVVIIMALNSINQIYKNDPEWALKRWKYKWFLSDGSFMLVYLITFCLIAYAWVPTTNNIRLALQQVNTEDDDENYENHAIELNNVKKEDDDDQILKWAETNLKTNEYEDIPLKPEEYQYRF